jgi:hypothetical protein
MAITFKKIWFFTAMGLTALTGCKGDQQPPVSFNNDIYPILQAHCLECHNKEGEGFKASGFSMESYEDFLKGTRFGPVIKPGDSLSSTLVVLIEGKADPTINMPHGDRQPLAKEQIDTIKKWIDQGALNN